MSWVQDIHIEIWGSTLDYFFINYTLRPGTLARRTPLRSHRQRAVLLSEVNSLHRISTVGTVPAVQNWFRENDRRSQQPFQSEAGWYR